MNKRGFTILETIIALGVVSLSIAGVFSSVRTGLSASLNSKDEIRAFYLGQEAVEALRNKKDANKLISLNGGVSTNWLAGIAYQASDPCYPGKTCTIDVYNANTLATCPGGFGSCSYLYGHPTSYFYSYSSVSPWVITKYKREIQIECSGVCGTTNEITITVRISWLHGNINKEIKIKTLMTNWK